MQTNDQQDSSSSAAADTGSTGSSSASAPSAGKPLVKTEISSGDTQTIPSHLTDRFPIGTVVVKHESGQLVANLPTEGGYHRVVVEGGQSIDQLAAAVESFQQKQATE